jgi:hypothetical protein
VKQKGLDAIEGVLEYINNHKKNKENQEKLAELSHRIVGFKVKPHLLFNFVCLLLTMYCSLQGKIVVPGRMFYREYPVQKVPKKQIVVVMLTPFFSFFLRFENKQNSFLLVETSKRESFSSSVMC